jgi:hypothetical protein
MDSMAYPGRVDEVGKFHPLNPGAFRFAGLPFKGKDVIVTFAERPNTRSNQQNRFFYGIVVKAFCEYMGYRFNNARDKEFVKDEILLAIGHFDIKAGIDGKEKKVVKPTHNLPAQDFSVMCEMCQQLGAEHNLIIPDPDSALAMGAKD